MSNEVDAAARREALRYRQSPEEPDSIRAGRILCAMATLEPERSERLRQKVAESKAMFYGHLAVPVASSVWLTLDSRTDRGKFGLLRMEKDAKHDAQAGDVSSWVNLEQCWRQTLAYGAFLVLRSGEESEAVRTADNLWEARRRALGYTYDLTSHMVRGSATASRQMMLEAYRMNRFLKRGKRNPSRDQRIDTMRQSPNPLMSAAGLEVAQFHAYNFDYGGRMSSEDSETSTINFGQVDASILCRASSGNITTAMPLEMLPVQGDGTIGEMSPRTIGPRIGCPVLLTPHLAQELWIGFVDSLAMAGFM